MEQLAPSKVTCPLIPMPSIQCLRVVLRTFIELEEEFLPPWAIHIGGYISLCSYLSLWLAMACLYWHIGVAKEVVYLLHFLKCHHVNV